MTSSSVRAVLRPVLDENPVTLHVLGVCSALAVTRTLDAALLMCAALTAVLVGSNAAISTIRGVVPRSIRLVVQVTVIASLVAVADLAMQAFAWSLGRKLSVFVSLIVTNCIVLGRTEAFALHHGVRASVLDGLGNGLGYSAVLIAVASVRELLAQGTLLGAEVLPAVERGGWFRPVPFLASAPSAFFLIALLVWAVRTWRPGQAEPPGPGAGGGGVRP